MARIGEHHRWWGGAIRDRPAWLSQHQLELRLGNPGSMVRAILPDELRRRQWIWPDEASRWNAEAACWAGAGFTDRSALAWLDMGLQPEDAGYLAAHGVEADALDKLVPVPITVVATGHATARLLLTSGRLPVTAVYEALVQAGHHVPAERARTPVVPCAGNPPPLHL